MDRIGPPSRRQQCLPAARTTWSVVTGQAMVASQVSAAYRGPGLGHLRPRIMATGGRALFAAFVAGGVLAEAVPPRVVVLAWMDTMRAETAPSSRAALMDLEVTRRGARPAGSASRAGCTGCKGTRLRIDRAGLRGWLVIGLGDDACGFWPFPPAAFPGLTER